MINEVEAKFRDLQGQILGLQSALAAILEDNVDLIVDETKIGGLILNSPVDHVDVQDRAREIMHALLSGRDTRG